MSEKDVPADAVISIRHLRKEYGAGAPAVSDLSLDVREGEFVCLVGPSGCGKTTTLKMINRLIEPTSGDIFLAGTNTRDAKAVALRRGIGYVIQQVGLFPHRTVRDNVASVLKLLGWSRTDRYRRADEMLSLVELDPATYAGRYPSQLSGGQRQRVGVARALAADPPVLLMDEPFSAIDPIARSNLQQAFLGIQRSVHKTVVMVTHDVDEALLLADRIAIFSTAGTLEQFDAPRNILGHPANEFVTTFLGADKGIRQLSVTAIPLDRLGPVGPVPATPTSDYVIGSGSTLRTALSRILQNEHDWLLVVDDTTGEPLGSLTTAMIHSVVRDASAARRSGQISDEGSETREPVAR